MKEAKFKAGIDDSPFTIPWFLDAKNASNIAFRDVAEKLAEEAMLTRKGRKLNAMVSKPKSDDTPLEKTRRQKPTQEAKLSPAKGKVNPSSVIRVLVSEFGHKAGSKAETKSAGLKDGMTVAEYMSSDLGIAGKWHTSHINHCLGKNFISLEE